MKALFLTVLAALLLGGCGSPSPAKPTPSKPTQVNGEEQGQRSVPQGETAPGSDERNGASTNANGETLHWTEKGPTEDQLTLPFFPGSRPSEPAGTFMKTTSKTLVTSSRVVKASPKAVVDFYKPKLSSISMESVLDESATLSGLTSSGGEFSLGVTKGESGEVEIDISVLHQVGKPVSQDPRL